MARVSIGKEELNLIIDGNHRLGKWYLLGNDTMVVYVLSRNQARKIMK